MYLTVPGLITVLCMTVPVCRSQGILSGPANDAFYVGDTVTLNCVGAPGDRIQWWEYTTNPNGAQISDNEILLPGHPNNLRYHLDANASAGTYHLTIMPTVYADGGTYECHDYNTDTRLAAQLIVIGGPTTCATDIPPDGFVLVGEQFTIDCTLIYRGNVAPTMTWTGPDLGCCPWTQDTITTNVSVRSTAHVTVTNFFQGQYFSLQTYFTQDGFLFPSSATNVPTWNTVNSTAPFNFNCSTLMELTGQSGSFSSQNFPSNYFDNTDCQWRITAVDVDGTVSVDFTQFSTEQCCDKVYLYDGNSTKAQVIATLSGQLAPPTQSYNSTQRCMYIRFVSDDIDVDTGFNATFTSIPGSGASPDPCSPDFRPVMLTGSGELTSSDYPANYQNNADCRWLLTATGPNDTVVIEFSQFSTEACCDLVHLYDGNSSKATVLAVLSGQLAPPTLSYSSTQRYMFVRFESDDIDTDVGFSATFSSVLAPTPPGDPCLPASRPMALTGEFGWFASPNYPGDYNNNADCQWLITAIAPSVKVRLDFVDFLTEACCDRVALYDGNSTKDPIIEVLGGELLPGNRTYNSTQRYMFIRLLTDDSHTEQGFNATFTSVMEPPPPPNACSSADRPVQLTEYSGSFTSQNYPDNYYQDNSDCQWLITAVQSDAVVTVDFNVFSTEQCCDPVIVYDGNSTKAQVLASLTGTLAPPTLRYVSTQRYMFIRFTSDDTGTDIGFSATYSSPTSPCSPEDRPLNITAVSGTFASTNFPGFYDNNADCQWLIVSVYQIVELTFNAFSTESCCDWVYVRDGNDVKSPLLASLSGSPPSSMGPFMTSQAFMLVRFTTDDNSVDTGFSAQYTSIVVTTTTTSTTTTTTETPQELTSYY